MQNIGPEDPHEFLIIRVDDDFEITDLPVVDGRVPEDQLDIVDLTPGRYFLLCNIAEIHDGELESRFELGMRTEFLVR